MTKYRQIPGVRPGEPVAFTFNGLPLSGHEGDSIAAALMRAGVTSQRHSSRDNAARAYYCGMGQCWECAVHIDGIGTVRSCMQRLAPDMVLATADKDL